MGAISNNMFTALTGISTGKLINAALSPLLGKTIGATIGALKDLSSGNFVGASKNLKEVLGGGSLAGAGASHGVMGPAAMLGGGLLGGGLLAKAGFAGGGAALAGGGLLAGALGGGTILGGLGKMMGGAFSLAAGLTTPQGKDNIRNAFGATYVNGGPGSAVNKLPKNACFEDLVAALMFDIVKDMQRQARAAMDRVAKTTDDNKAGQSVKDGVKTKAGEMGASGARAIGGNGVGDVAQSQINGNEDKGTDSRDLMFEEMKQIMQKLSACQQAMSNIFNTMHENAMNPIRNIKA